MNNCMKLKQSSKIKIVKLKKNDSKYNKKWEYQKFPSNNFIVLSLLLVFFLL